MPTWKGILIFGWGGLSVPVIIVHVTPGVGATTNTYIWWTLSYVGLGVLALIAKKRRW